MALRRATSPSTSASAAVALDTSAVRVDFFSSSLVAAALAGVKRKTWDGTAAQEQTRQDSRPQRKGGEEGRRGTKGAHGHQKRTDQIHVQDGAASRVSTTSMNGSMGHPPKPKRPLTSLS